MYCSSCGVDSVEGLKYCKRCGANIATDATPQRKLPVGLVLAFLVIIAGVFTLGMAVPSLTASEFHELGFNNHDVMILSMVVMGLTFAVIAMLVWLLFMLIGVSQQHSGTVQKDKSFPEERIPKGIAAPPQSAGSVTESTTRTLDQRKYDTPRSLG